MYFQFIEEFLILEIYRTNLINENELVPDLGAGTRDFSIFASRRLNQTLKTIQRNDSKTVIPMNSGSLMLNPVKQR